MKTFLSGRDRWLKTLWAPLLLVPLVFVVYGGVRLTTAVALEMADAARFRAFARRIVNTDHVVVTNLSIGLPTITIAGEDAQKLVRAVVSSGRRFRLPPGWDEGYQDSATFLAGTNALGGIRVGGSLFQFNGKRYQDDSGVLQKLVHDGDLGASYKRQSTTTKVETK